MARQTRLLFFLAFLTAFCIHENASAGDLPLNLNDGLVAKCGTTEDIENSQLAYKINSPRLTVAPNGSVSVSLAIEYVTCGKKSNGAIGWKTTDLSHITHTKGFVDNHVVRVYGRYSNPRILVTNASDHLNNKIALRNKGKERFNFDIDLNSHAFAPSETGFVQVFVTLATDYAYRVENGPWVPHQNFWNGFVLLLQVEEESANRYKARDYKLVH
jgi:hypothetical protein